MIGAPHPFFRHTRTVRPLYPASCMSRAIMLHLLPRRETLWMMNNICANNRCSNCRGCNVSGLLQSKHTAVRYNAAPGPCLPCGLCAVAGWTTVNACIHDVCCTRTSSSEKGERLIAGDSSLNHLQRLRACVRRACAHCASVCTGSTMPRCMTCKRSILCKHCVRHQS